MYRRYTGGIQETYRRYTEDIQETYRRYRALSVHWREEGNRHFIAPKAAQSDMAYIVVPANTSSTRIEWMHFLTRQD